MDIDVRITVSLDGETIGIEKHATASVDTVCRDYRARARIEHLISVLYEIVELEVGEALRPKKEAIAKEPD